MDKVISTPRLKLTLVTEAPKGSPEYEWFNEIWTDEKATWWSISGRAQTPADIEKIITRDLPDPSDPISKYRVVYAVHRLLSSPATPPSESEFIGLTTLKPILPHDRHPLPPHVALPPSPPTLPLELAYMFLPASWNQGFATEALGALLAAVKSAPVEGWAPYERVHVRAIVNQLNPASSRVLEKIGVGRRGSWEWKAEKGERVYLAGEWRVRDLLVIHGVEVVGS